MWFLTTLVFVALFYIVPLSYLIYTSMGRWQILPVGIRSFTLLGLRFNLPYLLVMAGLYVVCYLLLRWFVAMAAAVDEAAIQRLDDLTSVKGLRGFNRTAMALIVILVVVGFLYNVYDFGLGGILSQLADYFMGEPLFFLCVILFVGFSDNLTHQWSVSSPKRKLPFDLDMLEGTDSEEGQGNGVVKTYRWMYNGQPHMFGSQSKEYVVRLALDQERYRQLHGEPREVDVMRWDKYVRQASPEILRLAAALRDIRDQEEWSSFNEIENLLTFAQTIEYQSDRAPDGKSMDWPKYPLETLWDNGGDCEDSAILAASLLLCLGYDVALLFLPEHAALGIAGAGGLPGTFLQVGGQRYYYYETTATGWEFGELPERYQGANFRVLPIQTEGLASFS